MLNYNINEFQNNFSNIMEKVAQGVSVIITKEDKPIAKIEPMNEIQLKSREKRRMGVLKGMGGIPDDFDTMGSKEIEKLFYGG